MPLEIPQSHIEAFIRDPVMAAYVFFGAEMDVPQAARFRLMWFVPDVIDSAGISLGKSELIFWWANLRCALLKQPMGYQPRKIGIFYQTLGSARTIWHQDRFQKYLNLDAAKLWRRELRPQRGGNLGYYKTEDSLQYHFRNGSMIECPAVNLAQDSKTLAGRRYHDGATEEATQFENSSNALEVQILGRINAPCFNSENPLWTNHVVLSGHAENPDLHPFYKRRVLPARAEIRDGSQNIALITQSFRDMTPEYRAKGWLNLDKVRADKIRMSPATFLQIREGIWAHGTEEWYDAASRKKLLSPAISPEVRRQSSTALYTLGWDTASGQNKKNDWNFGVATKAEPMPLTAFGKPGVFLISGRCWRISPAWATMYQDKRTRDSSGLIHRAHQRFGFSRIVMDPGGGGLNVLKELWCPEQFFDNRMNKVTGLCTQESAHQYPEAAPLVHLFGRSDPQLQHVWGEERFRQSDEGPIHAIHTELRNMIESRSIAWPALASARSPEEMAKWEPERRGSQACLDLVFEQLGAIRVMVDAEGNPKLTKRGFLSFEAKGKKKKDGAYAFIYSLVAMLSMLMDPDFEEEDEEATLSVG